MSRHELEFDDFELDDLRNEEMLFLGDTNRYKKDDDTARRKLPNNNSPNVNIPQPHPLFSSHNFSDIPQRPPRRSTGSSFRCFAIVGFVVCAMFLVLLIASSTINSFQHRPSGSETGHGKHQTRPLAVAEQDVSTSVVSYNTAGGGSQLKARFTADATVRTYIPYRLSESLPGLRLDTIDGYLICCTTPHPRKELCGNGHTYANGLALDGYLSEEADGIVLNLSLNADEQAESRYVLTVFILES